MSDSERTPTTFTGLPSDEVEVIEGDSFVCIFTGQMHRMENGGWVLQPEATPVQALFSMLNMIDELAMMMPGPEMPDPINAVLQQSLEEHTGELARNNAIKLRVRSRKYKNTDQNVKDCSICKDDFEDEDSVCSLRCKHTYHFKCIKEWGKYKQECPVCRAEIASNK